MNSSDISIILFTDKKHIQWLHLKTYRINECNNQEDRHHDKMPTHIFNIQTVTSGISRPVTSGWDTILMLADHADEISEVYYHNTMLLNSYRPSYDLI